jgi:hypothetical protein
MSMNPREEDRLISLETRVQQLERKQKDGVWWLIECGNPATYYCTDRSWCDNPNHAHRFQTKAEAEEKMGTMEYTLEPLRIVDHCWG